MNYLNKQSDPRENVSHTSHVSKQPWIQISSLYHYSNFLSDIYGINDTQTMTAVLTTYFSPLQSIN